VTVHVERERERERERDRESVGRERRGGKKRGKRYNNPSQEKWYKTKKPRFECINEKEKTKQRPRL